MLPKFPELEEKVLAHWKKNKIFDKTLEQTAKGKRFVFFEGPPTANGKPGIHHVLARVFKDLIPRFKTMQGYFVERKAGWDTQGLPVELEVEKRIGVSGKQDIEKYGIEKFNAACRDSVWKYQKEWQELTERIGFWLDLEHPYITYHNSYIETLWWIFKQIWDKGLLVQGHKVVPQCPSCGTALSSHEVAQGYEKIKEPSVYVKLELVDEPKTYVLAWTTTPWTLPGNVALAVGKKIDYIITQPNDKGERFILASELAGKVLGEEFDISGAEKIKGDKLIGKKYQPLFEIEAFKDSDTAYKIYEADFVSTADGTGVVHTAVMYGEDDYQLGKKVGLPKQHTVNEDGKFNELVPQWQGKFVKDVDNEIIEDLKSRSLWFKTEDYEHDYPFCWRCHGPLVYYAKDSWFIKMSELREELIKNNEQINWVPEHFQRGRFGEWLNEVKDWAISRERYWGTPIPVWICDKCGEQECIGSFEELAEKTGDKKVLSEEFDPHRPFIDRVTFKCQCGGEMKRIPEVADTWFDSGSMPFAQWHYPFENKERIDKGISFPADYIAEAIDQTRGWFYTLLAISTALGQKVPPYKNVICLGHILDVDGQKMSKHIGNVINPWEVIDEFGIDAVRWYLYTLNQPGEYKRFDKEGVREVVKKNFLILWNVLSFYQLYQEKGRPVPDQPNAKHIMDRWILAKLHELVSEVTKYLENYQIIEAGRAISIFINELSTWYLRRSRERFKSDEAEVKQSAVQTLGYTLGEVTKLLAPFTPFVAEGLYQELGGQKDSVHLEAWPKPAKDLKDEKLIREMDKLRQIVELVHSARAEKGIKVRQPLSQLIVKGPELRTDLVDILKAEVNIQDIFFRDELPPSADWHKKEGGSLAVAIDTTITKELYYQGFIREVIRNVNSLRKQAGLTIDDQVALIFDTPADDLKMALENSADLVQRETLSVEIIKSKIDPEAVVAHKEFKQDKKSITFGIKKLG